MKRSVAIRVCGEDETVERVNMMDRLTGKTVPNFRYADTFSYHYVEWGDFDGDGRLHPDYFPQVVAYYEELIAEAGKKDKAAEALRQGLAMPEDDYPENWRFYDLAERHRLLLED